jgi:hypothetical protein
MCADWCVPLSDLCFGIGTPGIWERQGAACRTCRTCRTKEGGKAERLGMDVG